MNTLRTISLICSILVSNAAYFSQEYLIGNSIKVYKVDTFLSQTYLGFVSSSQYNKRVTLPFKNKNSWPVTRETRRLPAGVIYPCRVKNALQRDAAHLWGDQSARAGWNLSRGHYGEKQKFLCWTKASVPEFSEEIKTLSKRNSVNLKKNKLEILRKNPNSLGLIRVGVRSMMQKCTVYSRSTDSTAGLSLRHSVSDWKQQKYLLFRIYLLIVTNTLQLPILTLERWNRFSTFQSFWAVLINQGHPLFSTNYRSRKRSNGELGFAVAKLIFVFLRIWNQTVNIMR